MRKIIVAFGAVMALLALGSTGALASARSGSPDATPACGSQCVDVSSLLLGTSTIQNAYIYGDHGTGGQVGDAVDLKYASNSRPNEDFTKGQVGTLADFCGRLIRRTSYVCVNYPHTFPVYETGWTPFGNASGLCVGIKLPGFRGEKVTLQRCGASAATLWVGDLNNAVAVNGHLYSPWVNGADPNFSHPLVLTVNAGSHHPANLLLVRRLNFLTGHVVPDSQQFTLSYGPVP